MFKAILFDLDGTLLDTNELIISSYKYTIKKHLNRDLEDKEIVRYFGEPLRLTLERYDKEKVEEMYRTYVKYNEEKHDSMIKLMDNAKETLEELKNRGFKIGVVTSKRKAMAERGLKYFNLIELMDVIIAMEDTKIHKPNPEPLLEACRRLDILPSEVLYVGDSHYDVQCGKNAGSKTCVVKYTVLDLQEVLSYGPDFAINDLKELLKL
ncbi:pyrophosphatase PpaX [Caloramator sp. mosi_1]|uniref:pyrophosphatase PpaX n=1 Tax=Caloramator sp. mosi_1 TaxID=3023090 RepID=UPI0023621DB3|nr:pyrophosphatase PpaX [Caloramator sp. mosi_1]WDC84824.1 pyrophosphatase PpaX [Caloramator sp. mosi_1]